MLANQGSPSTSPPFTSGHATHAFTLALPVPSWLWPPKMPNTYISAPRNISLLIIKDFADGKVKKEMIGVVFNSHDPDHRFQARHWARPPLSDLHQGANLSPHRQARFSPTEPQGSPQTEVESQWSETVSSHFKSSASKTQAILLQEQKSFSEMVEKQEEGSVRQDVTIPGRSTKSGHESRKLSSL